MRILYTVQRYGEEVAGGAETHCRHLAEQLAARDHHVEVITSCAIDYQTWADAYDPGSSTQNDVVIHRLPVRHTRDLAHFRQLYGRVAGGSSPHPLSLQIAWIRAQGPRLAGLPEKIGSLAPHFDVAVFITYLYATAVEGVPAARRQLPVVMHPTAHDEPPIWYGLYDTVFHAVDGFAFLTDEERQFVVRRFGVNRPSGVIGHGFDLNTPPTDERQFRARYQLGDRPYAVFVGRLDPNKGTSEIYDFFTAYKRRHPGPLALVVVGEPVAALPRHPDVIATGFVDELTKHSALKGARFLVQPSYFESFSIVLVEAWLHGLPAIVQGRSDVLRGQAQRSCGALPYDGYASFEALVERLLEGPALGRRMGAAGRAFAERTYGWPAVLDRYESLLRSVTQAPARV